ncbi:MAG: MlaD family protein [Synechococcus sp.]|nr:MlaD family protein [Synechococcus sp.]
MRRSVREAIVGFSLVAAVASAVGLTYWLRGMSLSRNSWSLQVRFVEAEGLAERSPVVFRGVLVGNVRSVRVTPDAVLAVLEINNTNLRLARPVVAEVGEATLLGGEAQVKLIAGGPPLPPGAPNPASRDCDPARMLCNGSQISGVGGATLESVTALIQKLMKQADKEQIVSRFSALALSFDQTSRQATVFMKDGQDLVKELEASVRRAQPTIDNLNATTAHARNLIAALDNPKTVGELQKTVANAERLTARWEAVGGDVNKLSSDPQFMNGVRSVAIGLGKFFEELYPAQTAAAREKAAREKAANQPQP